MKMKCGEGEWRIKVGQCLISGVFCDKWGDGNTIRETDQVFTCFPQLAHAGEEFNDTNIACFINITS